MEGLKEVKDFIVTLANKYPKSEEGLGFLCEELISIGFENIVEQECEYDDYIGRYKYWAKNSEKLYLTDVIIQISNPTEPDPTTDSLIHQAYFVILPLPLNKYIGLIRSAKIKQIMNGSGN